MKSKKNYKKRFFKVFTSLLLFIFLVIIISFTFLKVNTDFGPLDEAPDEMTVPDYYSDIWFKGQGYPIRHEFLKEGWSELPGGGRMFILPYVLTKLPYKNLEESKEWIEYVNKKYKPNPMWTFDDRRRKGNYRCMAQAASTVSDWHATLLGNELQNYKSIYTGEEEIGLNYKILDSIYYQRAALGTKDYHLNRRKLMEDPVSHTPVPFSLSGYARILSLGTEINPGNKLSVQDYNLPINYSYSPKDFHIYSKPITIFRNKAFWEIIFKKEPKLTQSTIDAIHKHGILYGGIKARFSMLNGNLRKTRLGFIPLSFFSGHGVSIVGYIQKHNNTYFIYRETFGLANKETSEAGVAYRMFPIYGFNEIYAFSQPLQVKTKKLSNNLFEVEVKNAEGKSVELEIGKEIYGSNSNPEIKSQDGKYFVKTVSDTSLIINKDYFYKEGGKSYSINLN